MREPRALHRALEDGELLAERLVLCCERGAALDSVRHPPGVDDLDKSMNVRIISLVTKGQQTREAVLARAVGLASEVGLDGLTIGGLASDLGMSKSGLFAHFGSKEALQEAVLRKTMERFVHAVVEPAQSCPPGERRVRALFQNWLRWSRAPDLPGGCPFVGASAEFDSQSGPVRDVVASTQRQWIEVLAQAVQQSLGDDFRRDLDPERFAFELYGIYLTHHLYRQLFEERRAEHWAEMSLEELIERSGRSRAPQRK